MMQWHTARHFQHIQTAMLEPQKTSLVQQSFSAILNDNEL